MPLDASIYQAFGVRPKSVAEFDNEAMQREQNQLALLMGRQKADEYTQGVAETNRLRQALAGGADLGTPEGQRLALAAAPLKAGGIIKDYVGLAKDQAQTGHYRAQAEGEAFKTEQAKTNAGIQRVIGLTDPTHAASDIDAAVQAGKLPAPIAEAMKRSLPQDPAAFPAWKLQVIAGIADPAKMVDMLRPHLGTVNAGGTTAMTATDPLTGRPTITGTVAHTQTPDNVATNATSRANTQAHVAATIRGQNLVDARAREAHAAATGGAAGGTKAPAGYRWAADGSLAAIPGGPADPAVKAAGGAAGKADKPLTEAQAKAMVYRAQMEDAERTLATISFDPTKWKSQADVRLAGGGLNVAASADAQRVQQAQEQWSESFLRFKTGAAATRDEIKRNAATFFPVFGDSAAVVQQKAAARQQAVRDLEPATGRTFAAPSPAPAPGGKLTAQEQAELAQLRQRFRSR